MKYMNFKIILILIILTAGEAMAQTSNDSLAASIARLTKTVQSLEKIKFSGYIQMQYQVADTLGAKSYNGGDFAAASAQRFQVRRGYLKMAYTGKLSTYVLQVNVNDKGFTLRDAYFSVKEPWLKAFSLTGGVFFRPFGQELSFSTSQRESPELARVTQVLFPNERDLGASITFQMPDKSPFHMLKAEAGLFSGNSIYAETDDKLDFIGRIGVSDVLCKNKFAYGVGVSTYNGSVYQAKKETYEMSDFGGTQAYRQRMADTIPGKYFKRSYLGMDAMLSLQTKLGKTSLRYDLMIGKQTGSDKSSTSPAGAIDYTLYMRNFYGGTYYLVQTLFKNKHSVVLKFDFYDPNTDIAGNDIGKKATNAKATNGTDVAFATWGFGWITDFNQNLRVMLYYDLVKNETSTNLTGYTRDQKDNVFTVRMQYKF